MAEGERLPDEDVAVAVMVEVVQIGAAEAGRLDGDLDLIVWKRRELSFLLDTLF